MLYIRGPHNVVVLNFKYVMFKSVLGQWDVNI